MNELDVDYVYEFNRLLESPCSISADVCIFVSEFSMVRLPFTVLAN